MARIAGVMIFVAFVCVFVPGGLRAQEGAAAGDVSVVAKETLATLNPSLAEWPKVVVLKEAIAFPVVMDGKTVGSVKIPAGSPVKPVAVEGGKVVVDYQGNRQAIESSSCDLLERVLAARKQAGIAAVAAVPAVTMTPAAVAPPVAMATAPPIVPVVPVSSPVAVAPVPSVPVAAAPVVVAADTANGPASTAAVVSVSTIKLATNEQVQAALERAGENRAELEKAIAGSHDTAGKEMALLISHASQYDLVNLTSDHLLDNVNTYLKARHELEWGRSIPEDMSLEYVLPYRVADEDLDDWRPDFYKMLSPLIKDCHDTKTAALLIHQWLYKGGDDGKARIDFKVSESRDQTPRQLLNKSKIGRCFEMNLLLVALLRSVGIPARHAGVPYWTNVEQYHYWVEYWDTGSRKWLALEPNANPDALMEKANAFPVVYAFPGYHDEADPIGREHWEGMTNVTSSYTKTGTLDAQCTAAAAPATFCVYVWNCAAWRLVASAQGTGRATFEMAVNEKQYPYLVSASVNGKIGWQFARVSVGKTVVVSVTPDTQPEMLVEYKK